MKRIGLALTLSVALGTSAALVGTTHAMPAAGLNTNAVTTAPVEKTQFIFGGRNYCFYLDGWHGPGWYWCGYANRRGFGWGGPEGWHNWHRDDHDHDHHDHDHHDHDHHRH